MKEEAKTGDRGPLALLVPFGVLVALPSFVRFFEKAELNAANMSKGQSTDYYLSLSLLFAVSTILHHGVSCKLLTTRRLEVLSDSGSSSNLFLEPLEQGNVCRIPGLRELRLGSAQGMEELLGIEVRF